jgi:hypothetical protein
MMMQELPCVRTPQGGREVSVMKKGKVAADTSAVEKQGLETYEMPAVLELGTVEDLTWEGSTDFYVST